MSDITVTTMSFPDGLIHLAHVPEVSDYCGYYHIRTSTVVYGGSVEKSDEGKLLLSGHDVPEAVDRASFIASVCAMCDSWDILRDEDNIADILLGLIAEAEGKQKRLSVKTFLDGVVLYNLPPGPWHVTPEGVVDGKGNLVYVATGTRSAAPPTVTQEQRQGIGGLIRGLFGGGRRNE